MRRFPGLALALLLPLSAGVALPRGVGSPPNGLPDVTGTWTGRVKLKAYDLSGASGSGFEAGSCPAQFVFSQTGKDLTVQVTTTCPDDPSPKAIALQGEVGNYHLWAQTPVVAAEGVGGDLLLLSAAIRTNGTAMKGIGILTSDNGASVFEFKFNANRDDTR